MYVVTVARSTKDLSKPAWLDEIFQQPLEAPPGSVVAIRVVGEAREVRFDLETFRRRRSHQSEDTVVWSIRVPIPELGRLAFDNP